MDVRNRIRGIATMISCTYSLRRISENPLQTLLFIGDCLRNGSGGRRVCEFCIGGIHFFARPADWCAIDEVMRNKEYSFIKGLLGAKSAPVIFDLGANIGLFSIYAFNFYPKARIVAVEAACSTHEMLLRNIAANPGLYWMPVQAAIWNENGTLEFNLAEYSTGSSVAFSGYGTERVPAITLTELFKKCEQIEHVDLLKMDIEGAEQEALFESEAALERVFSVIVEVHPSHSDPNAVADLLERHFGTVFSATGRKSSKPVFIAARDVPINFAKEFGMMVIRGS